MFDTLMVFLRDFFENVNFEKKKKKKNLSVYDKREETVIFVVFLYEWSSLTFLSANHLFQQFGPRPCLHEIISSLIWIQTIWHSDGVLGPRCLLLYLIRQ